MSDKNDPNLNEDLTEDQIFRRMSQSIRENDFDTLDSLAVSDKEPEEDLVIEAQADEIAETPEGEDSPEAVEVQSEVKPEPATAEVKEEPSDDWTAELPERARQELKKFEEEIGRLKSVEHRYKAESGRVPYLQRKLAELEKKLQAPAVKAEDAPVASSGLPKDLADALAQIEDVDPVTASAFKALHRELTGNIKKTEDVLGRKEEEELLNREWQRLTDQIPDAQAVFDMPEWEEWKERQTPALKAAASSSYADDVIVAIERFARDMAALYPQQPQTQQAAEPVKEAPKASTPDPKAVAIQEQRTRRLAATTPSSATPAATKEGEPSDPDALFAHFYRKEVQDSHLDKRR